MPRAAAGAPEAKLKKLSNQIAKGAEVPEVQQVLDALREEHPSLGDHFDLVEAELKIRNQEFRSAQRVYLRAAKSITSSVRVRARVGYVEALALSASPQTRIAIKKLVRDFPNAPVAPDLYLAYANALSEKRSRARTVTGIYRMLDARFPESSAASTARERMETMRAEGRRLPRLPLPQQLDRAARLVRVGTMDLANEAVSELLDKRNLRGEAKQRVLKLAGLLARREGRKEDAERYLKYGGKKPRKLNPRRAAFLEKRSASLFQKKMRRIVGFLGMKKLYKVKTVKLLRALSLASQNENQEWVDKIFAALEHQKTSPYVRFRALTLAAGMASDEALVNLLGPIAKDRRFGSASRYHYARALERLGKLSEAKEQFKSLLVDPKANSYYRVWSRSRLASLTKDGGPAPLGAIGPVFRKNNLADKSRGRREAIDTFSRKATLTHAQIVKCLSIVKERHGEAYPWLARAESLAGLGELDLAASEVLETYLAWRAAHGRAADNFGLEAVYRGTKRARKRPTWKVRIKRKALDDKSIRDLSRVAVSLGDYGIGIGLAGKAVLQSRPLSYASIVRNAAAEFGVDPDLVFAVMRVESVYHRRIVSYAGAVGLMQIMPGTGRRIAQKLGKDPFLTSDLLSAKTNIRFAAWYLASLVERFDGSVPLAVASYNGGPHNVRLWIDGTAEGTPLDLFLERIPFTQTHRYVRRVLTHYAAYRAKHSNPTLALSTKLPRKEADPVGF